MKAIELYINNALADIQQGENISVELFSPIFKDISELGENFSYSITLPATPRNNAIFGFANRADVSALNSIANLAATLFVGGIPLIQDGKVTLLSVSPDAYDISITWGGLPVLRDVWDRPIGEVYTPSDPAEAHLYWRIEGTTGLTPIGQMAEEGYGYWRYFGQEGYEGSLRFNRKTMLPMVSTNYLLSLITNATGATFNTAEIQNFLIPLTTLNGSQYATLNGPNGIGNSTSVTCTATLIPVSTQQLVYFGFSGTTLPSLTEPFFDSDPDDIIEEDRLRATDGKLNIIRERVTMTLSPSLSQLQAATLYIESYDANDTLLASTAIQGEVSEYSADFIISYESEYDNLAYIRMRAGVTLASSQQTPIGVSFNCNAYATYWVMPNRYYPVLANLPKLTCGQLIEALCRLCGVYAEVQGNAISFFPLSAAVDDSFIRDKSSQYRSDYSNPTLISADYSAGGFAQRNKIVYEVGEAKVNGDGAFEIDNPLLPEEAVVAELPFTPTETLSGLLHLPLWDSDGKWQGFDGIPIVSVATTTFDDTLKFSKILANTNYLGWVQLMRKYVETTFLMDLSVVDISQLKWEFAWQIDALGAAYMPMRISYSTEGISEVTAIKIV